MIDKICFHLVWALYDLAVVLPLCFYVHAMYSRRRYGVDSLKGLSVACLGVYLLVAVVAYITPDFPSYQEIIALIQRTKGTEYTHLEPIWTRLALGVGGNMFAFRLVLFFFTFLCLYKIVFLLIGRSGDILLFFFFYGVFGLYKTVSGREYLALFFFFYGVLLFWKRKKAVALAFFFFSVILHKAAFIYFLPFLATGFKLTKKRLKLYMGAGLPLGIVGSHLLYRYVESNGVLFPGWIYLTGEYLVEVSAVWKWLGYLQIASVGGFALAELALLLPADKLPYVVERLKRYLFYSLYIVVLLATSPVPGAVAGRLLSSFSLLPMMLLAPYCWRILSGHRDKWLFGTLAFVYFLLTNVYIAGISNRY